MVQIGPDPSHRRRRAMCMPGWVNVIRTVMNGRYGQARGRLATLTMRDYGVEDYAPCLNARRRRSSWGFTGQRELRLGASGDDASPTGDASFRDAGSSSYRSSGRFRVGKPDGRQPWLGGQGPGRSVEDSTRFNKKHRRRRCAVSARAAGPCQINGVISSRPATQRAGSHGRHRGELSAPTTSWRGVTQG